MKECTPLSESALIPHREQQRDAEIAELRRLLEDERNRRTVGEVSAKKALDAQRAEADRREAAHAALTAELERRSGEGAGNGAQVVELQRHVDSLQQALALAKQSNGQLRAEKEKILSDRAAADDSSAAEVETLRFQMTSLSEKFMRENKRFEAERDRHAKSLADLTKEVDRCREELEEEKKLRREETQQAVKRERDLQEAKDVAMRQADARVAAALAEHSSTIRQLEARLADAQRVSEQANESVAKREAAEGERLEALKKELQRKDTTNAEALDALQSEMQKLVDGWENTRSDFEKKLRAANELRSKELRQYSEATERLRAEYEERIAALSAEIEGERTRVSEEKAANERRHKEALAALNAKVREAWAATKVAEDRAHEWDRALAEANSKVEAEAKALDIKHQALVEAYDREQQRAKELAAAVEAAHVAAKQGLEEALAKERSLRAADKEAFAKAERDFESRQAQQKKDFAEEANIAKQHHEAALKRLEDLLAEERAKREELIQQKAALHEGMEVLNREYDDAVSAMELLEAQLRENRSEHEHAMAALTLEMERSRTLRSNSVAAADAAEAEVQALKTEVQLLKRKLKRNICSRCGGSGFPTTSLSVDPSTTQQLFYIASPSQAPTVVEPSTSERQRPRETPTNGRKGHMWNSDDEGEDGKRYGESGDF